MQKHFPVLVLLAVMSIGLAACGGGGAKTTTQVTTKTLGQELSDLKAAYEGGAMSEKEYEKARQRLLKKYN